MSDTLRVFDGLTFLRLKGYEMPEEDCKVTKKSKACHEPKTKLRE
jgi:hypothetical protein